MTDHEAFTGLRLYERYRLEEPLVRKEWCVTYRGTDEVLKRRVTIKAVPPDHVQAYRAALNATSALSHPAIVLTWDTVSHADWLFLIQECVNGIALAGKIAVGLSQAHALTMALQLSRVLAYAHKHAVIHGDLTPSAVTVERDGTVRLDDFALPPDRAYFAASAEAEATLARALSVPGEVPSLMETDPASAAADVRAVGLLLWQTLATAGPSGARRDFRADVPAELRHLVARTVVRSHPEQITTAEELAAALHELAAALSVLQDEEEEQPTPPLIQLTRTLAGRDPIWSTQDTVATGPLWGNAPAPPLTPSPISSPHKTRVLPEPDETPVVRPGLPSGPLGAPVPSGPFRAPVPSGPLRAPVPTGSPRAITTPSQPLPYVGARSGPLSAPPIPWSDDPVVARWATNPARAPGGRGTLVGWLGLTWERRGIGVLPVVVIGIVLFIVCFVVGYLMPLVIPLR